MASAFGTAADGQKTSPDQLSAAWVKMCCKTLATSFFSSLSPVVLEEEFPEYAGELNCSS